METASQRFEAMPHTAKVRVLRLPRLGEISKQARLNTLFSTCVIVSSYLLIWSTLSTSIDSVDEGVLSMSQLLPPTYWAGFTLLLAGTTIWYFTPETKKFHFILLFLWIGYLFVGPELMEVHPRQPSSYGQALGITYVREGLGGEFGYFPHLGFHYFFAMLVGLLDIDHLLTIRMGMLLLYFTLSVALLLFLGKVLPNKKSTLLAVLIALALLSVTGLPFAPSSLALILMLFSLYLLAKLDSLPVINRLMLITIYSAVVVTHGLSSLMLVYLVALSALATLWSRGWSERSGSSTAMLSLLFGTIFAAWLFYSSDFLFENAVIDFRDNVLREPFAFTSAAQHVSPARAARAEVAVLTSVFLAILLVWLLSTLSTKRSWSNLTLERFFPLLAVSGMPMLILTTGNFGYEGFVRVFVYSIPFLALFLARESVAGRSAPVFLVVLLSLGFVLLYAREFEELPPATEFAGANFLASAAEPDSSILQGENLAVGVLTNTVQGPATTCLGQHENLREEDPSPDDFTFTVLSKLGESAVSFMLGEERWERLSGAVQGDGKFAKMYSNGDYEIFARLGTPR